MPDRVQRVHDHALVDDCEDRPPQSDEGASDVSLLAALVEQLLGASVIQQDAPFAVAYQNALRQVGQERCETVLLRLETSVGVADSGFHVVALRAIGAGKARSE